MSDGNTAPAGWYPADGGERYWDGSAWTSQTRPTQPQPLAPTAPQAGYQQPGFQQPGYQQPPHKKTHGLRNVLLIVVLLFVLLMGGCLAVLGLGASEVANDANKRSKSDTSARAKNEDKPKAEDKAEEPAPVWETVAKLSGNTNKAGPDFSLSGCETRMTYDVQGDPSSTLVAFYVQESGTQLTEDGGFPVASPTKTGPGQTTIRKDEGDYYVEVVAANADWQVQVQERC